MSYFKQFSKLLKQFNRSEDGAVAVLVAVLMVLLIVFAGMAIDFGMGINTRRALSQALDNAVLAAANRLSTEDLSKDKVEEIIDEYLQANLKGSLGKGVELKELKVGYEPGGDEVSASVSAELKNNFMPLINLLNGGGDEHRMLNVGSSSTARYPRNNVEVTVIVDVTGSMYTHMDALKSASTRVLDALLPVGTNEKKSKIRVSFVPYSEGVKLETTLAEKATFYVSTLGCVHERVMDQAATDVAHDYEDDDGNTDYIGSGDDDCPTKAKVVPLTTDRSKIEDSIDDMEAGDGTAGQTGIAWGWYTISPEWADFWPDDSQPQPYDTKNIRKFAIFMTDGEFNRHYADKFDYSHVEQQRIVKIRQKRNRGTWTEGPNPDGSNKFTRSEHQWFASRIRWEEGTSSGESGIASVRAKAICESMKAKKITIYSVHFGDDKFAERVMKSCASNESTFYNADSDSELIQAFETISNDIKDIYLSQ